MKIAVQFAGDLPTELADAWYRSVRRHMKHPIVHLTDLTTPAFAFADEVQRIDEQNLLAARFRHLAALSGDVLSLDYDIIVQADVSDVFEKKFDIALTKREAVDMLTLGQPHNLGVIFTRCPAFWETALQRLAHYPECNTWMLSQVCVTECAHVNRDKFNLLELPAELYNYTPKSKYEPLDGHHIIHYKGARKHWMVDTEKAHEAGRYVASMSVGNVFFTDDHPNAEKLKSLIKEKNEHNAAH